MESLTRLVSESLARHGFDRPLDYRRLHWSRWFRCESHHSLLSVPSKPGVFAIAEEIMNLGTAHVETAAKPALSVAEGAVPRSEASGAARVQVSSHLPSKASNPSAERLMTEAAPRRMLAVTQFFEDDDMAFVLDRMLSRPNPMRARLESGRYFIRFVVIEDQAQRRSICSALNQWMVSAAEKTTGIGSHFATSLELTPSDLNVAGENVERAPSPAYADAAETHIGPTFQSAQVDTATNSGEAKVLNPTPSGFPIAAPQLSSGAATNIHCPSPFPSGF